MKDCPLGEGVEVTSPYPEVHGVYEKVDSKTSAAQGGVVQGIPLGLEIDDSTSESVSDSLRRLKGCKKCISHFWTLRRVF